MTDFVFESAQSLQDLSFTVACIDISISQNGKKLLASGIYKPAVKLFDLKPGVMKCERHLVSEPIKNFFLDEDGEKFAVLRSDKTIEFHIKGGLHDKIKIPNQPKDVVLNSQAAELYMGGNYNEINRFNLEQGRFMKSIPSMGASRMAHSKINTTLGTVSKKSLAFIDSRSKSEIFTRVYDEELVAIAQDSTGLKYVVATESGALLEYDFRSSNAIRSVDLGDFPVKAVYSERNIVASTQQKLFIIEEDAKVINEKSAINPNFAINTFCQCDGAILIGGESTEIKTFICESFGRVPEWIFTKTNE